MNQQLLNRAGLSEREINEKLLSWLDARLGTLSALFFEIGKIAFGKTGEDWQFGFRNGGLFSESLDSMALITGAMILAEMESYVNELESLWRAEARDSFFLPWLINLDAETRAVAAILALGLEVKS